MKPELSFPLFFTELFCYWKVQKCFATGQGMSQFWLWKEFIVVTPGRPGGFQEAVAWSEGVPYTGYVLISTVQWCPPRFSLRWPSCCGHCCRSRCRACLSSHITAEFSQCKWLLCITVKAVLTVWVSVRDCIVTTLTTLCIQWEISNASKCLHSYVNIYPYRNDCKCSHA